MIWIVSGASGQSEWSEGNGGQGGHSAGGQGGLIGPSTWSGPLEVSCIFLSSKTGGQ